MRLVMLLYYQSSDNLFIWPVIDVFIWRYLLIVLWPQFWLTQLYLTPCVDIPTFGVGIWWPYLVLTLHIGPIFRPVTTLIYWYLFALLFQWPLTPLWPTWSHTVPVVFVFYICWPVTRITLLFYLPGPCCRILMIRHLLLMTLHCDVMLFDDPSHLFGDVSDICCWYVFITLRYCLLTPLWPYIDLLTQWCCVVIYLYLLLNRCLLSFYSFHSFRIHFHLLHSFIWLIHLFHFVTFYLFVHLHSVCWHLLFIYILIL